MQPQNRIVTARGALYAVVPGYMPDEDIFKAAAPDSDDVEVFGTIKEARKAATRRNDLEAEMKRRFQCEPVRWTIRRLECRVVW
jgi:hypothetical protein